MGASASGEVRARTGMSSFCDKPGNDRKRHLYQIGFLEGALASKRIEDGELDALQAEADAFAAFFQDPDAGDLAEDLRARRLSGQKDMMTALEDIVADKRAEPPAAKPYSERDEITSSSASAPASSATGSSCCPRRRRCSTASTPAGPCLRDLRHALEAALADGVLTPQEPEELRE